MEVQDTMGTCMHTCTHMTRGLVIRVSKQSHMGHFFDATKHGPMHEKAHLPTTYGNHPSACSGTPIILMQRQNHYLRHLALRTRGGKLKKKLMGMLPAYRSSTWATEYMVITYT